MNSKNRKIFFLRVVIYSLGVIVLLYFTIRINFPYPEAGSYNYESVDEMRSQCLIKANPHLTYEPHPRDFLIIKDLEPPDPNCLISIVKTRFFWDDVFWDLGEVYAINANQAFNNSDYEQGIIFAFNHYFFKFHHFIVRHFPFVLLTLWSIVGIYVLLYDLIPDFPERVLEGFGVGILASIWGFYAQEFHWQYGGFELSTPAFIWIISVLMFLSIDVRKRQFDNLLIKVALFFVGILLLTLLSGILELDVNYFIVPLVIAAIASFYHYWRSLSNLRLKIGSLAFIL